MPPHTSLNTAALRLLLDSTAEGIYGIDLKGNCTFANRTCVRMLGYERESDLLGRNMHALIHHSMPDGTPMRQEDCLIYRAFIVGEGSHCETEVFWRADGSRFPVIYWSYPQKVEGAAVGAVVTFLDITVRKAAQEAAALKTALLEAQAETSIDGIIAFDESGKTIFTNSRFFELWKVPAEIRDTNEYDLLLRHAATQVRDPEAFIERILYLNTHADEIHHDEFNFLDGRCFARYSAPLRGKDGTRYGRISFFRDNTARKRAEEALKSSETRYRLLAENSSDVIWTLGLDRKFTYISPSITRLRGYSVEEAMAQSLEESLSPESLAEVNAAFMQSMETMRRTGRFPPLRGEYEQPCKDGSTVWVEITTAPLFDGHGGITGILGVSRDVTERRKIQQRLLYLAQHDELTGLANRALFTDRLERAIALAARERRRLALLFIDLDHFKPVNDGHGHAMGDLLLREAARRMSEAVRASDTVGRIGGDEFLVLLPGDIDADGARVVAEKVRISLARPFALEGLSLAVSATIGIALYPDHGRDAIQLTGNADSAMYRGKGAGGNTIRVFGGIQNPEFSGSRDAPAPEPNRVIGIKDGDAGVEFKPDFRMTEEDLLDPDT